MTTQICATIFLALVSLARCEEDPPKGQPPAVAVEARPDTPLAERIAALKREFEAWEKSLTIELEAVRKAHEKGSEARSKAIVEVLARTERDWQAIANRVGALVREHPTDPAAFDGILLLRASLDDDLLEIVREHFLNDPRIGQLCAWLPDRWGDSTLRFLEDVAAKNPDRSIRGQATCSLGLYSLGLYKTLVAERRVSDSELEQLLTETNRKFYKQMIAGRRLAGPERERLLSESRGHFDRVVKDYPDVRSVDGTSRLADRASSELIWIANIPGLEIGKVAPEVVGEDLDGKPLSLSDHRGKVVVLCFWATWCGPCMAMVPHERELFKRMEGKPFALLGVNSDEVHNREKAKKAARDERMIWPSFWDGGFGGPIQTRFNVQGYPTIYVLDVKGVIRFINVRGKDLDRTIDVLLRELETGSGCDVDR